jgi:hypothetical protein
MHAGQRGPMNLGEHLLELLGRGMRGKLVDGCDHATFRGIVLISRHYNLSFRTNLAFTFARFIFFTGILLPREPLGSPAVPGRGYYGRAADFDG